MKSTTTTKTFILLTLVFIGVFSSSCDPKKNLIVKFNMEYGDIQFTAIPDTTIGTISIKIPVNSTLEQSLQQNGASKDQIKSITIKESRLDILSPSHGNFDFLGSIYEFIGKDSVSFSQVANKEIVPMGVSTLALDVTPGNDISEALKSNMFYYKITTTKRAAITDTLQIKSFLKFEVIAEVVK